MKYRLKVDKIYIFAYLAEIFAVFIILSLFDHFNLSEVLCFTAIAGIIISIPIIGLYYGTYFKVDQDTVSIFYFGFIKKSVPIEHIAVVNHNYDGRGTLSLSEDKLLIKVHDRLVPVSIMDALGFTERIEIYRNQI